MPQGLRNAPPVHQRQVMAALHCFLGIFAHIYLDDIIIWSNSLEEHIQHVKQIMTALWEARLYCNLKKSNLYLTELIFLGHCISQQGIEACSSKVDKILNWPRPKSATDVFWVSWGISHHFCHTLRTILQSLLLWLWKNVKKKSQCGQKLTKMRSRL